MNRVCIAETQVQPERAKHLKPKTSASGVFALHGAESANGNARALGGQSAPVQEDSGTAPDGRLRSAARRVCRAEAAAAFATAAFAAGASDGDIGAAIDEQRQRVLEMRAGDRPITAEHLVLLQRRSPVLFKAFCRGLFGGAQ